MKKQEPLVDHLKIEDQKTYHEGIQVFSSEILQKVIANSKGNNALISPLGISFLLSMIKHGVGQEDQKEIENIAHLPANEETLRKCAFKLIEELTRKGLNLAGLLYLNPAYRMNRDFETDVSLFYKSKVECGSSAEKVNAWVKNATNGQIKEIITQDDLIDFFIVLANAIHFKATWEIPFSAEDTHNFPPFATEHGDKIVEMMHIVNKFENFENENCQAVKFSYKDKKGFSMILILPKKNNEFSFVDHSLLASISANATTDMVKLRVPKFKIEEEVDVKSMLSQMGVNHLFNKADFSKLVDLTHPLSKEVLPNLTISKMTQKSVLECNEKGTEASSVTKAVMINKSLKYEPEHSKEIKFNRPFLAVLTSEEGIPIQFGVIRNPEPAKI